jgi:hypothetical protein
MPKDKLNLDQLMNNLNQVGLNVINFDECLQEQLFNEKDKIKMDSRKGEYLCIAYIFYKWNEEDTLENVLEKAEDNTDTIHTMVMFYSDKVVLNKTDCKIYDPQKHILEMSYSEFTDMMNKGEKIEGNLYDWEKFEF